MKTMMLLAALQVSTTASAGDEHARSLLFKDPSAQPVTGNLRVDLFGQTGLADGRVPFEETTLRRDHKSPYIAAGLSLVVPGAGEFYTEHYWESIAFFAADVAAWILAYKYDNKGDRQTDFFQNYANAHWSALDYALFSRDYYIPETEQAQYHIIKPNTEGLPPWSRVNWEELNRMERYISSTQNGQYYSHNLPRYGDQQYYELIGKYQQFYQGWDDRDTTLTTYDAISQRLRSSPQARMIYYSIERGKANDFYTTATAWVTVAIVNHIANAAYAALTAGWYNSAHAELGLQRVPTEGGYTNVPVVKVRWEF